MLEGSDGPPEGMDPKALFRAVRNLHDDMGGSPIGAALGRAFERRLGGDWWEKESLSAADVRDALAGLQGDLDKAKRLLSDVGRIARGAARHELTVEAMREFRRHMRVQVSTTKVYVWPFGGEDEYEVELLRPLRVEVLELSGGFMPFDQPAFGVTSRWVVRPVDGIRPGDVAPGCDPDALRVIRRGRRGMYPGAPRGAKILIAADRVADGPQPDLGWGPRR